MLDFKNQITMLDGGMGTMLQAAGVPMGKVPEALNVTHAEAVIDIHRQYIEAGADIIYANTFSANRYKLGYSDYSVEELVTAGVVNAKKAAAASERDVAVALDVGPIGELMEPNGSLKFEDAYDMFKKIQLDSNYLGGAVNGIIPDLQRRIEFLESLLPYVQGVKYLKHAKRIRDEIDYWKAKIEHEEMEAVYR